MKIGTKIVVGYTILIIMLLFVQAYQISLIRDMLRVVERLQGGNFPAMDKSLKLNQKLSDLRDFTTKYAELGYPEYGNQISSLRTELEKDVTGLSELDLQGDLKTEADAIVSSWKKLDGELESESSRIEAALSSDSPDAELGPLGYSVNLQMAELEALLNDFLLTNDESTEDQIRLSRDKSAEAREVAWWAFAFSLGAGGLVSLVVVRSISGPLGQLKAATSRIAEGDFTFSVDASGKDDLAELAANFNLMVRRLDELDQLKKDFVSHVSHELKAPLASINETTKLLLEQLPGPLTEQQQRLLELNLGTVNRLSAMIRNLLDLSTLEAGGIQYNFERRDLVPLIRDVIEEYEGLYRSKNLQVVTEFPSEPVPVLCDRDRCVQVVGNLLANSVKFSHPGGEIKVRVEHRGILPRGLARTQLRGLPAPENGYCVVSILDRGPGVPVEKREKIFERFYGAGWDKKLAGPGTGLGLAIAREIVVAHSGAIWVEDNPAGGSIFSFLLPALKDSDTVT